MEELTRRFDRLADNVERFVLGKPDVVRAAIVCLFAEGHLLIEDVPGVGKTSLARCLANSIDGSMSRIQFTPDLLPSDVTGVQIYNSGTTNFDFHEGPVFANLLVADEINRASPRTQSALLEVMEERQVTVDGSPYRVPRPFMVLATQNPVEMDGTYPLPEAQIDRFMMRISIGYPDVATEVDILRNRTEGHSVSEIQPVMTVEDVADVAQMAAAIHVESSILEYVAKLSAEIRRFDELRLGVSPRGSLALVRAAQVQAAMRGRAFVTADDVKDLAGPVLEHRLLLTPHAELDGVTAGDLVGRALGTVPVPDIRSRA